MSIKEITTINKLYRDMVVLISTGSDDLFSDDFRKYISIYMLTTLKEIDIFGLSSIDRLKAVQIKNYATSLSFKKWGIKKWKYI